MQKKKKRYDFPECGYTIDTKRYSTGNRHHKRCKIDKKRLTYLVLIKKF